MKRILSLLFVAGLLFSGLSVPLAFAEPGPNYFYINPDQQECGIVWIGDEYMEYRPESKDWVELFWVGSWSDSVCEDITDFIPNEETLPDRCEELEEFYGITDTLDPQLICDTMGYTYVGELPYTEYETDFSSSLEFELGERVGLGIAFFIGFLLFVYWIRRRLKK